LMTNTLLRVSGLSFITLGTEGTKSRTDELASAPMRSRIFPGSRSNLPERPSPRSRETFVLGSQDTDARPTGVNGDHMAGVTEPTHTADETDPVRDRKSV